MPGPLGRLLARVYQWEVSRRNRRFDAGRGVVALDRPVISVGNLSVGGTGKTPFVSLLVRWLREDGCWPCVAMRGYSPRGAARDSDEAALYRREFPDLPLVVGADRTTGLLELFASEAGGRVDRVVLDDGFQHRALARDLDIVLLDATRDPFADRCLPAGWLREPAANLSRAHAAVVTHAEHASAGMVEALKACARSSLPGGAPVCVAAHEWSAIRVTGGHGAERDEPTPWLRGRRVLVCCAIGNPGPLVRSARNASGADPVATMLLRDHDPYEGPTIARVIDAARRANADTILTTEKDWVKLAHVRPDQWPCPVARPRLILRLIEGEPQLRARLRAIAEG
jgi:tetraacyldisaccharide 4'-kinase